MTVCSIEASGRQADTTWRLSCRMVFLSKVLWVLENQCNNLDARWALEMIFIKLSMPIFLRTHWWKRERKFFQYPEFLDYVIIRQKQENFSIEQSAVPKRVLLLTSSAGRFLLVDVRRCEIAQVTVDAENRLFTRSRTCTSWKCPAALSDENAFIVEVAPPVSSNRPYD